MKQYIYLFIGLFVCHCLAGQTSSRNFVHITKYTTEAGIVATSRQVTSYYDGLGRPIQQVEKVLLPSGTTYSLATLQEYDAAGRPFKNYLPSVIAGGGNQFVEPGTLRTKAWETYQDSAYHRTVYENSPLGRIQQQFGPGKTWYDSRKALQTSYLVNTTTGQLRCAFYKITEGATTPTLVKNGDYANGKLHVTLNTDESGNQWAEFRNSEGQLLLQRQIDPSTAGNHHDTYYVYDLYGNLAFVLPPEAAGRLTTNTTWTLSANDVLKQYAYVYQYDNRNRLVYKKLPGAEHIRYVYDKADRLILTQDGAMRAANANDWFFTIPDIEGRTLLTGTCRTTVAAGIHQLSSIVKASFDASKTATKYYDISGVTMTNPVIYSAYYYDHYEFLAKEGFTTLTYDNTQYNTRYGDNTAAGRYKHADLLTGEMRLKVDGNNNSYLYTAYYYDEWARCIQQHATNHLTGHDRHFMKYNFVNELQERKIIHEATGKATQTELYTYTYDTRGNLLTSTHKLGTGAVTTLVENTYDQTGRLATSRKGGHDNLKTTLTYNVRSWPTRIASHHFWENLTYGWNGNITKQEWGQAGKTRSYTFAYDNLSRLRTATYAGDGSFGSSYTYDKNGNIKTLTRSGQTAATTYGVIDNLTLEYTGNQLKYVTDSGPNITYNGSQDFKDYTKGTGTEYTFDQNGRMTKDLNKGIGDIQYNWLHLPSQVDLKNQAAEMRKTYTYAADGTRLSVDTKWNPSPASGASPGAALTASALTATKKTDYVANKVYENGTLKKILVDGGYYDMTDKKYYFFVTDHLGSTRIVGNTAGSVVQHNQNDPFGVQFAERTTTEQDLQPYKYTGQELDRDQGLNLYDYHARQYDPAIGRFTTMDPLAEKYYSISPYAYCANNPVNAIDLRGDSIWFTIEDETIIMNVTGKVLNISSNTATNLHTVAKRIAKRIEKSFKGTVDGYDFKTNINLSATPSIDNVEDSDHLFVLTDMDIKGLNGAANNFGGKVAFIDSDYFSGLWDQHIGDKGPQTAAHEFGHLLNLEHIRKSSNLMTPGAGNTWWSFGFTKVTENQLSKIIYSYKKNYLNRGSSSELVPDFSPNRKSLYKRVPNRGQVSSIIKY